MVCSTAVRMWYTEGIHLLTVQYSAILAVSSATELSL